jgi:Ca2+-binding EF-hand superfamily protein
LFDIDGKGKCSSGELENTLNGIGLFPKKHELYLVMKKFDRDYDGKIQFTEFADLVLPTKREYETLAVAEKHTLENKKNN